MPGREDELGRWVQHAHTADEFIGDGGTSAFLLTYPPLGKLGILTQNGPRQRNLKFSITDTLGGGRTLQLNFTPEDGEVICFDYAY